ncbi:hypothetical protein HX115_10705 [Acinetobacter towneri]|nr:hypothetical protein [Acinetobacter towneri]MDM1722273.1 hypothetical protein [Acinetobacter towneri]
MLSIADLKIAVIGLGYVGLPLAVEFGKKVPVVGLGFTKNGLMSRKVIFDTFLVAYLENLGDLISPFISENKDLVLIAVNMN